MANMARGLLATVIVAATFAFGCYWYVFGRPDWLWNGPKTIAISGQRFAVAGLYDQTRGPVQCLTERRSILLTGLEYCVVDEAEPATGVLFWYLGEVYTINMQEPLGFP
ncbi:hypothetical protein ACWIGW_28975 [Nocardia brasiliensis]